MIIKEIGRKLAAQTGEQRATSFLIQKVSIELPRLFWELFRVVVDWMKFYTFSKAARKVANAFLLPPCSCYSHYYRFLTLRNDICKTNK